MQMPLKQTGRDEEHALPHAPQLNGSRPRSAQLLPHGVWPDAHIDVQ